MASYMAATPNNNGGYDYDLVSQPPDRLVCKICRLPSRDPYLSVCCGHIFCKFCLDNVKRATAITNACPVCRDEEFMAFPQKEANREIKSLHIYCTKKEKGCEWQGELNDITDHLGNSDGCQFEEVKCSNECGKMIQRQYLTNHIEIECPRRKVNCQYCHDTGECQFIEGQHKEGCPKLPQPCSNKCEVGSVPREDMEAHLLLCGSEMIQCEYFSVGCKVRMARKDKEVHKKENIEGHLMMTNHELTDTKAQLAIALKQINDLQLAMVNSMSSPPNNTKWPIILDVKATMLQSGNQICPVTIKMSNLNSKKKDEAQWYSDLFYTHNKGYKTGLRIYAAGHGDGKGTHLSVYLYLMKGPHDDELTWPLRGKFEIKLLNQISDSEHHSGTLIFGDDAPDIAAGRVTEGYQSKTGWGSPQYISNEDLDKITPTRQCLKDDCLFFQVTKL